MFLLTTLFDLITGSLKTQNQKNHTEVMAKIDTLLQTVNDLNTNLLTVKQDLKTKFDDLESQLSNADIPADAQTALDNLKTTISGLESVIPTSTTPVDRSAQSPDPAP